MSTIDQSFFPDLGPEVGERGRVKKLIVLSVDCTKAFAADPAEVPAEAANLRGDGLPPLHVGRDNLRMLGDNLPIWYQIFKSANIPIIALKDCHNWRDLNQMAEKAIYGAHADEDSYESELIGSIAPFVDYIIAKTTYDSFHGTDLQGQLESLHEGLHPLEVGIIVTGFVTHICVASVLLRLAPMGYRAIAPSFLMGDFNRIHHNTFVHNVFPTWGNIVIKRPDELCRLLGIEKNLPATLRAAA